MKQYRSLKDLPGAPVGSMSEYAAVGDSYFFGKHVRIDKSFVESNPDWFEEVKDSDSIRGKEFNDIMVNDIVYCKGKKFILKEYPDSENQRRSGGLK